MLSAAVISQTHISFLESMSRMTMRLCPPRALNILSISATLFDAGGDIIDSASSLAFLRSAFEHSLISFSLSRLPFNRFSDVDAHHDQLYTEKQY